MKFATLLMGFVLALGSIALAQEPITYSHIQAVEADETSLINAVENDPADVLAQFNAGAYYYNQVVSMIMHMDQSMTPPQRDTLQQNMEALFRKALPYAEKAHQLDPGNLDTILMLIGIHYGLQNQERWQHYLSLLDGE